MEDVLGEAINAYAKYCNRHGYIFQQPAQDDSEIGRKYVNLRNGNGDLAKYDIRKRRIVDE